MRFLADENFPGAAVAALQTAGHDVVWVRLASPGAPDSEVASWAAREGRILLTFDKDFGELVGKSRLPEACGVVLFRLPMPKSESVGQAIANLVMAREDWLDHFSVIEPGRVRMRPRG